MATRIAGRLGSGRELHVYGGDRVRISSTEGLAGLAAIEWTRVKVVYDATTGEAIAWVNGATSPSLRGIDLSLTAGRVGNLLPQVDF